MGLSMDGQRLGGPNGTTYEVVSPRWWDVKRWWVWLFGKCGTIDLTLHQPDGEVVTLTYRVRVPVAPKVPGVPVGNRRVRVTPVDPSKLQNGVPQDWNAR
jgi:hypothetical protein